MKYKKGKRFQDKIRATTVGALVVCPECGAKRDFEHKLAMQNYKNNYYFCGYVDTYKGDGGNNHQYRVVRECGTTIVESLTIIEVQ